MTTRRTICRSSSATGSEVLTGYADMKKQTAEIEKRFKYYDRNNSGTLDFGEFDAALTEMNLGDAPKAEIRALFDRYDANGDEQVSYTELINGVFEVQPHLWRRRSRAGCWKTSARRSPSAAWVERNSFPRQVIPHHGRQRQRQDRA